MDERIAALTAQIEKLQAENTFLKCLLDEVGISYVLPASKPTAEISKQLARRFYSYFWGRTDVYSKRSVNKTTGKAGYYPQCENLWKDGICPKKSGKKVKCGDCANRKWRQLEAEQIMAHLRGEKPDGSDVIGIYPLFPDGTCKLLVFDFDNHEKGAETLDFGNPDTRWMEEVDALRQVCEGNKVPCLVERSRSGCGGHLWIFFESAVEAAFARRFGMALLRKGAETVNLKRIGYTLYAPDTPEKQAANAIFDSDTYHPVFEQDLREAVETVLISSPTLSRKRVENLVELLLPAQEQGLKAAVITWHPDVYRYGNDENRLLLLESLRTAGFEIQYAEETCQHFAVIDEKIVWYGSMNLLSRDDVEDNIMRLESREVAEELLGIVHFCE